MVVTPSGMGNRGLDLPTGNKTSLLRSLFSRTPSTLRYAGFSEPAVIATSRVGVKRSVRDVGDAVANYNIG